MENSDSMPIGHQPAVVEVDLTWVAGRIEHRIFFGHSVGERVTELHRKTVLFAAGSVFAVLRWAASDLGLTVVRLEILRASKHARGGTRVPFVRPEVDILLRASGWSDVQRVIKLIDAIQESGIDPTEVAPDYWLHVGNRLAAGEQPRGYTRARHLVWQLRRRIAP
jgi:hypothetical protein